MQFYTGIGSRETPETILSIMTRCAMYFARQNYILRSGGATGADSAFQDGVIPLQRRIYLPWSGFNKQKPDPAKHLYLSDSLEQYPQAIEIAKSHYKKWDDLKPYIQNLHARNVFQLLGETLDTPSEFVIFWAEPYKDIWFKGGTGFTLRIAKSYNIPYYNLRDEDYQEEILGKLEAAGL